MSFHFSPFNSQSNCSHCQSEDVRIVCESLYRCHTCSLYLCDYHGQKHGLSHSDHHLVKKLNDPRMTFDMSHSGAFGAPTIFSTTTTTQLQPSSLFFSSTFPSTPSSLSFNWNTTSSSFGASSTTMMSENQQHDTVKKKNDKKNEVKLILVVSIILIQISSTKR